MKTRRVRKRFCVAVVFCAAVCTCVAPAAEVAFAQAHEISAFDPAVCETAAFGEASQARLVDVGRQVLDPEQYVHPFGVSTDLKARTLPAVPAAIVLTLFGFLCVSITRDRRTWLALAAGLIWLGQAGILNLPQFANRIRARTIGKTAANPCLSFSHTIATRPTRSEEKSCYAGLLHKLAAIPGRAVTLTSRTDTETGTPSRATDGHRVLYPARITTSIDTVNKCPASTAGQIVRFSPAFEFCSLSRGPPAGFREDNSRNVA